MALPWPLHLLCWGLGAESRLGAEYAWVGRELAGPWGSTALAQMSPGAAFGGLLRESAAAGRAQHTERPGLCPAVQLMPEGGFLMMTMTA